MAPTLRALAALACAASTFASAASGTCALNGVPCPPPTWEPEWSLTYSTICQPSAPGYFIPPSDQPWGLISLDWSVAKTIWSKNGLRNGTIEATSITGCEQIKAISPKTRCFIYHNMELALEAMESQRAVMYDPAQAGMFLQYTDGKGVKNGTIYNEPGGPGDQYFWDFRNSSAASYYVSSVMSTLTSSAAVDGTFTDDVTGFPAEHEHGPANINMSAADVAAVDAATSVANQALITAAVAAGKYVWQAFGNQDGVGSGPSKGDCGAWVSQRCNDAWQGRAVTQVFDAGNVNQSIASFLVTRPPIAFLGYGWESDQRNWHPAFLYDVGAPLSGCYNIPGTQTFTRAWSYGNATIDCANWSAVVPARA